MTEQVIGLIDGSSIVWSGGRAEHKDVDGFFELSIITFKITDLAWIPPTDDTDIQKIVEQHIKTVIDTLTYDEELLIPTGSVIGDTEPTGDSTAIITLDEPANKFQIFNRGRIKKTTATCRVMFVFKETLTDAKIRRKKASAYFIDEILDNPSVIMVIPEPEP